MRRFFLPAVPLLTAIATAQTVPDGTFLTAPYGPGGTWNLYQARSVPMTWTQAQTLSASLTDPLGKSGKKGHLVCIGSAAENMFVYEKVLGAYIWIGLTDNEKWGGKEAGTDRKSGWRWVTGEPVTYANWRSTEPNEFDPTGEDGVAMETSCRWADWPIGSQAQAPYSHPFMIEWETGSSEPVPGAQRVGRVLPEKWPVDVLKAPGKKGKGPWSVFSAAGFYVGSMDSAVKALAQHMDAPAGAGGTPSIQRIDRLNYRIAWDEITAGGWTFIGDEPPFPMIRGGCAALHVATVHLEKPGTWSFNVHGDDFFAIRFPGHKWKSTTGMGGLDPLDPETLYQSSITGDGDAIGVIDLPAGDSRVEVFLGNRVFDTMIQVLAAPGEITMDGGTDKWRHPGHQAAGDLAWPGMDSSGWKVTRADRKASGPQVKKLMDGLALVQADDATTVEGVAHINYIDSGAVGDVEFPNPTEFPGDAPGGLDQFAVRATGKLVIPRDGIYHIGIHADSRCALRIVGQKWNRIIRDTGYVGKLEGDTIYGEDPAAIGTNTQLLAEIELKKGNYEMEALYVNLLGPSAFSIFGAPAGYPPRLLSKDGGGIEPDVDGLPLLRGAN